MFNVIVAFVEVSLQVESMYTLKCNGETTCPVESRVTRATLERVLYTLTSRVATESKGMASCFFIFVNKIFKVWSKTSILCSLQTRLVHRHWKFNNYSLVYDIQSKHNNQLLLRFMMIVKHYSYWLRTIISNDWF